MKYKPSYFRHNRARLIRGGCDYFDLLHEMIEEAKESIHLQTYIFDEDETGKAVASDLIRASERGVKVYMLVDAYGSQGLSRQFVQQMTDAGIVFKTFRPFFRSKGFYLGRRLHHKVVVVDSHRATVAGLNISDRYNDTPEAPAWLDWALYVEGEVAPALEEICRSRLNLRHGPVKIKVKVSDVCPVGIRINDALRRKREIYNSYLHHFHESSETITIMSAYFLPGRSFRRSIADAAKRGVKIKVILTGDADVFMIKYAERYIYRWLFKRGIDIYEYRKNVLHAKLAIFDGKKMTIGSFNINNLSAYSSIELNLDVNHPSCVEESEQMIEEIVKNDCVRITEKKYNRQFNAFNKMVHKTSYEIFRFLFFLSTKQRG